jgi:hypothetical protein
VLMLALNVLHAQALQCQQVLTPELEQSALARSKLPVADKIVCPTCGPGDREISSKVSKSKTAHRGSKVFMGSIVSCQCRLGEQRFARCCPCRQDGRQA